MDVFSPQGSAEINGLQINNTLNFNADIAKRWAENKLDFRAAFPANFIAKTRRALNPAKYENNLAEARLAQATSVCKAIDFYRHTMPSLSDGQCLLLACGYSLTPAEADNVMDVLSDTASSVDCGSNPETLRDDFKDEFIRGSTNAYEEDVRKLWVKLLSSELKQPGTFSKRTLGTLKEMSREDAEAFQAFCSCAVGFGDSRNPIPVLTGIDSGGWTYDHESFTVDQMSLISSLGLVDTSVWTTFTVGANSNLVVRSNSELFVLENNTDGEKKLDFGNARFTPIGRELSLVCEVGTSSELSVLIGEVAKRNDMSCRSEPLNPQ